MEVMEHRAVENLQQAQSKCILEEVVAMVVVTPMGAWEAVEGNVP